LGAKGLSGILSQNSCLFLEHEHGLSGIHVQAKLNYFRRTKEKRNMGKPWEEYVLDELNRIATAVERIADVIAPKPYVRKLRRAGVQPTSSRSRVAARKRKRK
jgi:hypothetical protein